MKKVSYVVPCLALTGIIILIMLHSNEAKTGAMKGIELSLKVIIPSLLPILILTNSIVKSKCSYLFDILFGKITTKLFRLPKQATSPILFGLISGYPAGALLTRNLMESGSITESDARRILRFNFNGGIAFIITAVGTVKLENTKAGVILFLCNILSSIIIGAVQGLKHRNNHYYYAKIEKKPISDGIIDSVESSAKSVLMMSSYIILFSAISNMFELPDYVMPLLEITNGVFYSKADISFGLLAFFLSFGGLCIHFQIYDVIKKADMHYFDFLLHRIISGSLSYFLGKVYTILFPEEASVFSNFAVKSSSLGHCNTMLSVILLIGCVVLVFDIKNRKSELI